MATTLISECLMAEMVYLVGGQYCENVLHFSNEYPVNADLLGEFALCLKTWWDTNLKAVQSTGASLQKIIVTDISVADGMQLEYTGGLPAAGTNANALLPNNVTVAVKITSGFRGRRRRGRIYHIGMFETSVTGSTITGTFQGDLLDAYGELLTITNGTQAWGLGVAHKVENGVPLVDGFLTICNSVSVDPTVDSQRRRLPGRGR